LSKNVFAVQSIETKVSKQYQIGRRPVQSTYENRNPKSGKFDELDSFGSGIQMVWFSNGQFYS
jgi:hypothetical protein